MATSEYYFDTLVAPQMASNPLKNDFLSNAATMLNSRYYLQFYEWAVALQAAHLMAMAGLDSGSARSAGVAGAVSRIKEDELAIDYFSGAVGSKSGFLSDLNQTSYGKQLIALRRTANIPITVTGGNDYDFY